MFTLAFLISVYPQFEKDFIQSRHSFLPYPANSSQTFLSFHKLVFFPKKHGSDTRNVPTARTRNEGSHIANS